MSALLRKMSVLLVRPKKFFSNPQTKASNRFQSSEEETESEHLQALEEFESLSERLAELKIELQIFDAESEECPDSVFPNNWISFHDREKLVIYPMEAPNRRLERSQKIIQSFSDRKVIDLSFFENQNLFLEGTGSLILSRPHRFAFMAESSRSHKKVADRFSSELGYEIFSFNTRDPQGYPIYHTNVMMSLGNKNSVVCLELIPDPEQRKNLQQKLESLDYKVLEISYSQVLSFAGNCMLLKNNEGEAFWLLSETARKSLSKNQVRSLESDGELAPVAIPTIEKRGGGSIRCMIAEID